MSKLKKIYEYIDNLKHMYAEVPMLKSFSAAILENYRMGDLEEMDKYINYMIRSIIYVYYDKANVNEQYIINYIRNSAEKYLNSKEKYNTKFLIKKIRYLTYYKHMITTNILRDSLDYTIYLKINLL